MDWECTVFINGKDVGTHRGGFDPFTFDITAALKPGDAKQEIVVSVWDPTDLGSQPRGKQVLRPEKIWYTPVTGIWQTVWLEAVPEVSIRNLRVTSNLNEKSIRIAVDLRGRDEGATFRAIVSDEGREIASAEGSLDGELKLQLGDVKAWSPDAPFLYDLRIELKSGSKVVDDVHSYFAMRSVEVAADADGIARLRLNGKPLFHFGPLDQGWWPDGLYTAPTDEALRFDIEFMRQLGFNMCRKHVKVEPARWYYWADKLGLMVWQDMPSGMIGHRGPHFVAPKAAQDAQFDETQASTFHGELQAMIDALRFFPCIVAWVPFNEGWGQHRTNDVLKWVKQYDPTRLVNGPSGWEDRGFGDMWDKHDYPGPSMFAVSSSRASVLGEYGGLGWPMEGHLWWQKENWGYKTYASEDALLAHYEEVTATLLPLIESGLAAAIYTQLTDVEGEVNGLLTYDRQVIKFDATRMAANHQKLYAAFASALNRHR